jgi:proton-coupled amino acid transporter
MSVFSDPDSVPADDSLNANDALAAAHTEQDGPAEQGNADGDDHGHGLKSGSNLREATLAIIKSTIGPGILYMPKGFQEGGIFFSLPMIILSYCLFCWGSLGILHAWQVERLSYAQLMGRAFGNAGVNVVHFVIFCQQSGICLTYFIFVATNLKDLCASFGIAEHMSLTTLCLIQLLVYIPLVMIRNIQNFAYTNFIANALILYSLVVLSVIAAIQVFKGPANAGENDNDSDDDDDDDDGQLTGREPLSKYLWFNANSFYLFIGTSTYIFEGNMALVVPLQAAMREDLKLYFPRLFVRTLGGIVVLYVCFGMLNWMAYGDDTNAVLTVNLPHGNLKISVQLAYTIAVIFTFPLQLYPSIQAARSVLPNFLKNTFAALGCKALGTHLLGGNAGVISGVDSSSLLSKGIGREGEDGNPMAAPPARGPMNPKFTPRVSCVKRWRGIFGRALLAVGLCLIAIMERNSLTKMLSLLGAFLGIPLAYIFPSLIHLRLVPNSPSSVKRANVGVVALGVTFSLMCTVITIATWNSDTSGGR